MLTHGIVLCVRFCVSRCPRSRLNNITEGLGDNTESAPARRNRWCAVLLESGLGEGATICLPSLSQACYPRFRRTGAVESPQRGMLRYCWMCRYPAVSRLRRE